MSLAKVGREKHPNLVQHIYGPEHEELFERTVGDLLDQFQKQVRGLGVEVGDCSYQGQAGGAYEYKFWEKILLVVTTILDKIEGLFTFDSEGSAQNSENMHCYTDLCETARYHRNTGL